MNQLSRVEISKKALTDNIKNFRKLVGEKPIICPAVKANAYGHGLVETSKIFLEAGADWLAVNALFEAEILRNAKISSPIYVMGYIPFDDLEKAINLDVRVVVYNKETIDELAKILKDSTKSIKVHIKVETGNNRQGVLIENLLDFARHIKKQQNIELEGLSTHFANIEDTTDHSYALSQLEKFNEAIDLLEKNEIKVPIKHCANSAATILFPQTHFDMVRIGIAAYGMWPSNETFVSYLKENRQDFKLAPAFSWKTRIAQVKTIKSGEYIGYGCTYKTTRETVLAILPVGYYDGYDRCISGAHVLIKGKIAPVRGRVCMNIIMVDVSDIDNVEVEDEAVLIGQSGDERISAEQFAKWVGTINYEVTTRVNENILRKVV